MMNNKTITEIINAWFDGELNKSEEANLFAILSVNEDARETFRQQSDLKNNISFISEDFPDKLDERILGSIHSTTNQKRRVFDKSNYPALFGYALSIVMIIISLFLVTELRTNRSGLNDLSVKVKEQEQTIKLMFNAYPTIVVKPTNNATIQ
ncbi:MAG: hypothetical protein IPG53_11995 [Ignavibacteriales bacterium]|nr:hypothetical protein [Ignavibacteriales bacterium]